MKKPKMILFDYGQTLITEGPFCGLNGTAAVMQYATRNRYNLTPEQVQAEAVAVIKEVKRADLNTPGSKSVEVPNHMFTSYLYESLGITIDLTSAEIDRVFWDAASPGRPTEGMPELLQFLWEQGIRTAVLSNISYDGNIVRERINKVLPDNHFEFIIPTSEYLFRKPNPRIFRLALEKADLKPEDVWYIGDNYRWDVEGARSVGLFPVWYKGDVDYEQDDHDDVLTIMKWDELRKIIEENYPMSELQYKTLREIPGRKDDAAQWFHEKWGVPKEAYLECMDAYLNGETEYGWYVCLDGDTIVGGVGVIENDFHDRKDLTPNVCAVYTEESYRGRGIAGRLLDLVVEDQRAHGISPVYLVTDHTGFYERYGWEFHCMAQGDDEPEMTRLYIHR